MGIRVNIPIVHDEYPLKDHFKENYDGKVVSCPRLSSLIGYQSMSEIVDALLEHLPLVKELVHNHYGDDFYDYDIEAYSGSLADFRTGARSYLDYFKTIVFKSGGDDTHFDYIPCAVEEFIFMCQAIGATDFIQELYDSLWQEDSAYYPLLEISDDPGLHQCFENIVGVALHQDHPADH